VFPAAIEVSGPLDCVLDIAWVFACVC